MENTDIATFPRILVCEYRISCILGNRFAERQLRFGAKPIAAAVVDSDEVASGRCGNLLKATRCLFRQFDELFTLRTKIPAAGKLRGLSQKKKLFCLQARDWKSDRCREGLDSSNRHSNVFVAHHHEACCHDVAPQALILMKIPRDRSHK